MGNVSEAHSHGPTRISFAEIISIVHLIYDDGLVTTRSIKTYYMSNNYIDLNTDNQLYELSYIYS